MLEKIESGIHDPTLRDTLSMGMAKEENEKTGPFADNTFSMASEVKVSGVSFGKAVPQVDLIEEQEPDQSILHLNIQEMIADRQAATDDAPKPFRAHEATPEEQMALVEQAWSEFLPSHIKKRSSEIGDDNLVQSVLDLKVYCTAAKQLMEALYPQRSSPKYNPSPIPNPNYDPSPNSNLLF